MRQSQLLLTTLREAPAEAEVISHQLMLREDLSANWRLECTPTCHWADGCSEK